MFVPGLALQAVDEHEIPDGPGDGPFEHDLRNEMALIEQRHMRLEFSSIVIGESGELHGIVQLSMERLQLRISVPVPENQRAIVATPKLTARSNSTWKDRLLTVDAACIAANAASSGRPR